MSIKQKLEFLNKMSENWIPSLKKNIFNTYRKCCKCNEYFLRSEFKKSNSKITNEETTYTDAGYGDNDKYGEVEYMIDYLECPKCHYKETVNKHFIRILWEKDRYN